MHDWNLIINSWSSLAIGFVQKINIHSCLFLPLSHRVPVASYLLSFCQHLFLDDTENGVIQQTGMVFHKRDMRCHFQFWYSIAHEICFFLAQWHLRQIYLKFNWDWQVKVYTAGEAMQTSSTDLKPWIAVERT